MFIYYDRIFTIGSHRHLTLSELCAALKNYFDGSLSSLITQAIPFAIRSLVFLK